MLAPGQSPFPDNPVCNRCITKPCHRLFSGRVWAGKMIFVRHSDFKFLPCYSPQLKKIEEEAEEPALTDDIEIVTGKLEITNPRWELINDDAASAESAGDGRPRTDVARYVSIGDTILLMADIKNYPNGAPVTFDIFDMTNDPPLRIDTVRGENEKGIGKGTWVVADPEGKGDELELSFEAIARSKATEKSPIAIEGKLFVPSF